MADPIVHALPQGQALRAMRERAGVPLTRVANRLEVRRSHLERVEAGELPVTPEIADAYRWAAGTSWVTLTPADWVRPPGASFEVRLHGKRHRGPARAGGIEILRTNLPQHAKYDGWDLTPVLGTCHVRRAS